MSKYFVLITGDENDEVAHLPLLSPICISGKWYTHVAVSGRTVMHLAGCGAGECC